MATNAEKKRGGVVEWAIENRSIVVLVACCLIAFGVYALGKMNKNEFPDFTIREGLVVAVMPGKGAAEVEQQLTKPLEEFIFSYKEVDKSKTQSYSRDGMSIIMVELNNDLKDNEAFWNKFKHGMNAFKSSLPQNVLAVVVNDDFGDTSAVLLTIESKEKTYRELKEIAEDLEDRLRSVEEVGRMQLQGMEKEQINIYIDHSKLSHYGIPFETIAMTLFAKGFTTTGGTLREDGYNSPIRVAPSMNVEADVENLIVFSSPTGEVVRLKDIAEVRREYSPFSEMITNNGVKCLLLSIEMKQGRNITDMGGKINKILAEYEATLPPNVTLFKITDQPKVVGDSVAEFLKELLIAVVAVMIVILLLLPMRVALVASSTIPTTIFISLGIFYAFNIELNTVTLAALIMTLGMIVDNSIVIIDAYVEDVNAGIERKRAAIDSAKHFFVSILTATLAISITFFPLLLTMKGTFRDFLEYFPYAITIVLAVSLLVAEMVVPFLMVRFIGQTKGGENAEKKNVRDKFDHWLQTNYNKLVDKCFAHPWWTLSAGVASVAIAVALIPLLPLRLLPTADRNQFAVEIYLPTGSPLEKTIAVADSVESVLSKDERVVSIAAFKGCSSPRFQMGYAPQFPSENYAQFIVNTKSNKATEEVLDDYSHLHNAFADAYVRFKQLSYGTEANPVEVRLSGYDKDRLHQVVGEVLDMMRKNENLWLVRTDMEEPLMTTEVTLDEDRATRLGLNNTSLELTLASRYASSGVPLVTLWDKDYDIDVCLKSVNADEAEIDELRQELIPVVVNLRSVPLRDVAQVTHSYEVGQIARRNGVETITVKAEVKRGKNVTKVTSALMDELKKVDTGKDVSISYGGTWESNMENLPPIVVALGIAMIIIFFLLVGHYRNLAVPTLLLVGLTLTLFGAVVSVFIQRVNFGVTSFLGIISLMGILVRNAIIMYDYAHELQTKEGLDVKTAILMSAKRRMHPIFLTSAAASMGVIPMILGGSGLWQPMGVIICYGTLITMVFILTVLPIAYWKINKQKV